MTRSQPPRASTPGIRNLFGETASEGENEPRGTEPEEKVVCLSNPAEIASHKPKTHPVFNMDEVGKDENKEALEIDMISTSEGSADEGGESSSSVGSLDSIGADRATANRLKGGMLQPPKEKKEKGNRGQAP